jgi:hypothetical protein
MPLMFTAEQQTNDAEDAAAFISVLRFSAHESDFSLFHLQPSSLSFRGCTQKIIIVISVAQLLQIKWRKELYNAISIF